MNDALSKNQAAWLQKIKESEEKIKQSSKDQRIKELEVSRKKKKGNKVRKTWSRFFVAALKKKKKRTNKAEEKRKKRKRKRKVPNERKEKPKTPFFLFSFVFFILFHKFSNFLKG